MLLTDILVDWKDNNVAKLVKVEVNAISNNTKCRLEAEE